MLILVLCIVLTAILCIAALLGWLQYGVEDAAEPASALYMSVARRPIDSQDRPGFADRLVGLSSPDSGRADRMGERAT